VGYIVVRVLVFIGVDARDAGLRKINKHEKEVVDMVCVSVVKIRGWIIVDHAINTLVLRLTSLLILRKGGRNMIIGITSLRISK